MWKLFPFAFAVSSLISPLFADSGAHEYYDRAAWENAVANSGALLKDKFSSNSVSLAGVSVASYVGYNGLYSGSGQFSGGEWIDSIPKYGYTEWTFNQPVYAFGAHFRMDVQDGLEFFSGLNLSMPNARLPYMNNGRTRGFDGFYGFISRTPIPKLMISWGSDGPPCACYGQSYTMDNLEISTTPVAAVVVKEDRSQKSGGRTFPLHLPQNLPQNPEPRFSITRR
jgi:hypothetical protein